MRPHVLILIASVIAWLCVSITPLMAADSPAAIEFFETKIRPVLAEKCYKCHSVEAEGKKKLKGDLYLDSKAGTLKGGTEGPAVVPGDVDKSLLIQAIKYHGDLEMPPKEKLPDHIIADFEGWVKMGAPDPRVGDNAPKAGSAIAEQSKTHWAFQKITAPAVPQVAHTQWAHNDIDKFIAAQLDKAQVHPAPRADKSALIRRTYMTLIGLPPTAQEIAAFQADTSPHAFAKVVDHLLASPAYGERWGRHWLDVARYSDSKGYVFQEDRGYPYAYTYRDWVVQAFNDDMPYDRFLQLQIAADRLVNDADKKHLAAMGFMTVGRRFLNNMHDIIDDRLDVIGRGTMGVTISCSRCHDHKYDPIPTKDYYALYGVFASSEEPKELPIIGIATDPSATKAFETELAKREKARDDYKNKEFHEGLTKLRTESELTKYILAGWELIGKDGKEITEIANKRVLLRAIVQRWKDYLQRTKNNDPVFGALRELAGLSTQEFPARAAERFAALDKNTNPLVANKLKNTKPENVEVVIKQFATLLASIHADQPHADAHKEQLRLILRGDNAPTNIPFEKANDVLTGKEEDEIRKLQRKMDELPDKHSGAPPRAMVMYDKEKANDARVFIRGQPGNHGDVAPRAFLGFLAGADAKPFTNGSGRLELAQAITNRDNPLTARVLVNRVWTWHFGAGLVRTPSDFGLRTEAPVHLDLLNYLAHRFMAEGWSLKKLHRLMLLSATFQQSTLASVQTLRVDPENILWSRANRQRLDLESLRDAALLVSGRLDRTIGGRAVDFSQQATTNRRTIYLEIDRQNLPGMFRAFDFASPDAHTPQRFYTTVPQQALFLMNNPFFVEQSRTLAKQTDSITNPEQRVELLYKKVLARLPTAGERSRAAQFISQVALFADVDDDAPLWAYGYARYNPTDKTIADFKSFPVFKEERWQGGEKFPDKTLGHTMLHKRGGHPGNSHDVAVVRRFVVPQDGTYRVSGQLERPSDKGDGITGIIMANNKAVGQWSITTGNTPTNVDNITLKTGHMLDFVVDCNDNPNSDSFNWNPTIERTDGGRWATEATFSGPKKPKENLDPWSRLAQVLLLSNEFAFTD